MKICHNKKRNLGLIHEFLNMEIAAAIVENNKDRGAAAIVILENILSNKFLNQELLLHLEVLKHTGVSKHTAIKIVDELRTAGMRLNKNRRFADTAKKFLVKEITTKFGNDFFNKYRSEQYKVHSSVNILITHGLGKINEAIEFVKIEEFLVKYLSENKKLKSSNFEIENFQGAVSLYEKKYSELPLWNKELIAEYKNVCLGHKNNLFSNIAKKQLKELKQIFEKHLVKLKDDVELNEKLQYVIKEIESINNFKNAEEIAKKIVLFRNINEQISSNE